MKKKILKMFFGVICILIMSSTMILAEDSQITIATSSDALTLDPLTYNETPTNSVNANIFEALTALDNKMNVLPGLAESWENPDDLTWVFNLRKGVVFHNGDTFDADDVLFSLDRTMNHPKSQLKSDVAEIVSVKKIDSYTVEIKTESPFPILARKLKSIWIYSKEYVEQHDDQYLTNHPNGTGPYKLKKWVKDNALTLTAFDQYWNGKAQIEEVTFKPIPNAATRVAALLSGEAEIVIDLPVQDVDRVKKKKNVQVVPRPSMRLIFLGMNTQEGPFANLKVRQAVYYAINEDEIVKYVMSEHAYPAGQFYPDFIFGYNPEIKRVAYDPEKAKELLKEAGYPNGFEITLDAPNDRYVNDGQIVQAVAIQLAKVGIKINLEVQPKASYFNKVLAKNTNFYLLGWSNSNGDGIGTLNGLLHTPDDKYGRFNLGNYSNLEVDRLVEESSTIIDPEKRLKVMQEAVKLAMDDVVQIPLHYQEDLYGVKNNVIWEPRPDKYVQAYYIQYK
ncbi:MAG: ABC transporter substrate-binding protein [Halanaerobiales bacterium]|nr:ABC transporter substrate-binding protein [Halanaerobiales bacterium]